METSSPVSDERNISPKERASQAFEEFMGAWGTWRESHSHRMDAFRLMHRDTERKLKIQRSALDEACPRGAQVICEDVSTEGMSLRLEGVPRGNANADRRETTTTELTHDDVFDHARKLHSTMEEAFLSGRNFGGNLDECTYRGPLGFEASADDFLGFMATLLEMIDAEYDSQSAFLADMKIAQTRQQLYDLELQLAVLEAQPFVEDDTVKEIAHTVKTSHALAVAREIEASQAPTKKKRKKKKKKKRKSTAEDDDAADDDDATAATLS